jgi:hypothetical protein
MFANYTTAAWTPVTRDDGRAGKQANPAGPAYGFPDIVDRASGGAVTPPDGRRKSEGCRGGMTVPCATCSPRGVLTAWCTRSCLPPVVPARLERAASCTSRRRSTA